MRKLQGGALELYPRRSMLIWVLVSTPAPVFSLRLAGQRSSVRQAHPA